MIRRPFVKTRNIAGLLVNAQPERTALLSLKMNGQPQRGWLSSSSLPSLRPRLVGGTRCGKVQLARARPGGSMGSRESQVVAPLVHH